MFSFSASTFALLFSAAQLVGLSNGQHLGNRAHMWVFGEDGVTIFSADGEHEMNHVPPEQACHNVTGRGGSYGISCDFADVVSDGRKYVWAVLSRQPQVDIFSIDSGAKVGSFDTCQSPRDLDYHSLREEMWVSCGASDEDSHMDVFSVQSPSTPISTTVKMHDGSNARASGMFETDATLGDVGYATSTGYNGLHMIDLSSRVLEKDIDVGQNEPNLYGLYDLAFSSRNKHLFARTQVCCTCGDGGCGHYGETNITIGGQPAKGQCGKHCVGTSVDDIGIYEFDTVTNRVVGNHAVVGNGPISSPFASPWGDYIVLAGMNGGKTVQVLEAGENGEKSKVAFTIDLKFNLTNVGDDVVYSDFAFIEYPTTKTMVLSSANENKVAIVDLSGSSPKVDYVLLNNEPASSGNRLRQVEWAVGTNYVWVSGPSEDKAYVVDYKKKKLVKTIDIATYKFVSVQNDEFLSYARRIGDHLGGSTGGSPFRFNGGSDTDKAERLSIAAIFLSVIAIVAVLVNVCIAMKNKKSAKEVNGVAAKKDEQSLALPSVN
eukprot:scaffold12169_cov132-Cylindrotheca_fusiformis.AAC.10